MEEELYYEFVIRRKAMKSVNYHWFRRRSRALFTIKYPDIKDLFVFSNGWFSRFKRRYRISLCRTTKVATKLLTDYIELANRFIKYIRYYL